MNSDTVHEERDGTCSPSPLWHSSVRHAHCHPMVLSLGSALHLLLVSVSDSYILLHEKRADSDSSSGFRSAASPAQFKNTQWPLPHPISLHPAKSKINSLIRLLREFYDMWNTTLGKERNKPEMSQNALWSIFLLFPHATINPENRIKLEEASGGHWVQPFVPRRDK